MWQQWLNAVLGLGVLAVPFLNLASDALTWTLAIGGIAIAVLALWGAIESSPDASRLYQT